MFKEIVNDTRRTTDEARQTPDIGRSQKLTMSTLCSGELKNYSKTDNDRQDDLKAMTVTWQFFL